MKMEQEMHQVDIPDMEITDAEACNVAWFEAPQRPIRGIGIDVSEHNGEINWEIVSDYGMDFAIIRLGYGHENLDERFYENVNGALDAGIAIGVYFYSYALDVIDAAEEAAFLVAILADCGLTSERIPYGVWLDMEDADGYKARYGVTDGEEITAICGAFTGTCAALGYPCGIYASLSWLTDVIDTDALTGDTPYWVAQWNDTCDFPRATMWQHTDAIEMEGIYFDGNIAYETEDEGGDETEYDAEHEIEDETACETP